jgi:hypothetical protein
MATFGLGQADTHRFTHERVTRLRVRAWMRFVAGCACRYRFGCAGLSRLSWGLMMIRDILLDLTLQELFVIAHGHTILRRCHALLEQLLGDPRLGG